MYQKSHNVDNISNSDTMAVSKPLIIVAVVAVVAIAAVGAFVFMNGNDKGDGGDVTPDDYLTPKSGTAKVDSVDTKLFVFGNANNDVYLDNDDVKFIQDIVDKKTSWNKKTNPLADTNADGEITDKDVKLLKQFIAGKTAPMFYLNSYLDTTKIQFPLTGKIAVGGFNDVDMLKIIGKSDLVVACTNDMEPNEADYPGSSKWVKIGTYPYDYETVVSTGANITLGQPYMYDKTFDDLAKNGYDKYRMDSVKLCEARYMHGVEGIACTVTLGALMNAFNNSLYKSYLDYVANINSIVEKATANIKVGDELSYALLVTHACNSPSDIGIDNLATGEENYGDVATVANLKMVNSYPAIEGGYITGLSIEDVLKYEPDVIFIEAVSVNTPKEFHDKVAEVSGWLRNAGFTGKIVGITYSVIGNAPSVSVLPLLSALIYGENYYKEADAWKDLAFYYNTFLGQDLTVDELKESMYGAYLVE